MAKLAEVKTKPNSESVDAFIAAVPNEHMRMDSQVLLHLMEKITKQKPMMWGGSIIGFGYEIVKSERTGREVEWMKIGFAPRKANISLYLNCDVKQYVNELSALGKHKTGMGCLYVNKLEDVDMKVLEKLIKKAAAK